MRDWFASDGIVPHLVDGPWATQTFCGLNAAEEPTVGERPHMLCWSCAMEIAERDLADAARVSDAAVLTTILTDHLFSAGHFDLAAEVMADTSTHDPEIFHEITSWGQHTRLLEPVPT